MFKYRLLLEADLNYSDKAAASALTPPRCHAATCFDVIQAEVWSSMTISRVLVYSVE
jgi:hypothetical protein